jgi:hypothetical protein
MKRQYDFSKGKRGAVIPTPPGKTRITIRIDDDVLDWFRAQVHAAGGGNYQTLINTSLREYMVSRREPLEDTLRRVLREEFAPYAKKRPVQGSGRAGKRTGSNP